MAGDAWGCVGNQEQQARKSLSCRVLGIILPFWISGGWFSETPKGGTSDEYSEAVKKKSVGVAWRGLK